MTPFACQAVFDRDPSARRATYVDADVFFFDDPRILLKELDESGKHVLITEHAYAPEYDRSHDSGRFCVQFLTFDRSDPAQDVMRWWQERCLEWCFARYEDGKFGDQVYLDQWPTLFGDRVHIVRQVEKTLAPWNVRHFSRGEATPQAGDVPLSRPAAVAAPPRAALQVLRRRPGGPGHLSRISGRVGRFLCDARSGRHRPFRPTCFPRERFGWIKRLRATLAREPNGLRRFRSGLNEVIGNHEGHKGHEQDLNQSHWFRFCRAQASTEVSRPRFAAGWPIATILRSSEPCHLSEPSEVMSKTQRKLKKANHGRRPASSKARRLKRRKFRT